MREFDEILRGSFDAHAREIDRVGGPGSGLAARTVRDVRRRRAWRAAATGSVAAATVVGVVATAIAFTGDGGVPASQSPTASDPYSLGPCESFMPANGALLPDGMYLGRAYVDPAAGFVVAVMPDGAATRVQPDAKGEYIFDYGDGPTSIFVGTDYPMVMDFSSDGSGGGDRWVDAALDGWDWTLEPLKPAPAGVKVRSLHLTFTNSLGVGGRGFDPYAVPEGAVAEAVAIYGDGREVKGALVQNLPAPSPEEIDFTDLKAMALRVTLADGQVWEIRADYDPAKVPDLPCQPTPPSRADSQATAGPEASEADAAAIPAATAGGDQVAFGDPLSGPESAVFQCGAPLPGDLKDSGDIQARRVAGQVSIDQYGIFDAGDDGLIIEGSKPVSTVDAATVDAVYDPPRIPGWSSVGEGQDDGSILGNVGLVEVVALQNGVIVAAAGPPVTDWTAGGVGRSDGIAMGIIRSESTARFVDAFNGIHSLLVPCGANTGDLTGTELAVIYGFGPDADQLTYGWTSVTG